MIADTLREKPTVHKILVIDEVDTFESNQGTFNILVKTILKQGTNTSIVGIANSVDLPFKKKYSAIALRDAQILFEPYTDEQLKDILEQKLNLQY